MTNQEKTFSLKIGDQELIIRTGKLAQMANGSAVAQIGDTQVLGTAVMSSDARDGINFLPLMVNYQEKYYAAGMMKGSRFQKREARPSDDKILMGRVVDRQLRPMFPKHIRNDIQVMLTPISYDRVNEHDILSGIAASVALATSNIPWNGPTANVRVGMINGEFVLNPTAPQRAESELNLVVATSTEDVVMIDAEANEISEEKMLEAIDFGKAAGIKIAKFIEEIVKEIGKEKVVIEKPKEDTELLKFIEANFLDEMKKCIFETPGKQARFARKAEIAKSVKEKAVEQFGEERDLSQFGEVYNDLFGNIIRNSILNEEVRINGRKLDEIRTITTEVGLLPRAHGSALFQRGETQGLSVLTLSSPGNELITEGIEGEGKKGYLHHYNFPPFSVGEASNRLSTGNREIGHGALAEKALLPVLPKHSEFPYVIRIVTDILQSNGSSSMAATCGSTLAMMDGGVPLSSPVAGIAMGLMTDKESGNFKVLSDIQDEEDFGGDMDFKVAGTHKGITAIQMDIKIVGVAREIFVSALEQAKKGRLVIMEAMLKTIQEPREQLSDYAPRLIIMNIPPKKIRDVIGKGGETINRIIDETGVEMNIDDDGTVIISSVDALAGKLAKKMVEDIIEEAEVGRIYLGTVVRVEDYGAFVEILPGTQGLVHVSLISNERVNNVSDHLKVGQKIKVKLLEVDSQGRLRLSMKDAPQDI